MNQDVYKLKFHSYYINDNMSVCLQTTVEITIKKLQLLFCLNFVRQKTITD